MISKGLFLRIGKTKSNFELVIVPVSIVPVALAENLLILFVAESIADQSMVTRDFESVGFIQNRFRHNIPQKVQDFRIVSPGEGDWGPGTH